MEWAGRGRGDAVSEKGRKTQIADQKRKRKAWLGGKKGPKDWRRFTKLRKKRNSHTTKGKRKGFFNLMESIPGGNGRKDLHQAREGGRGGS